ncbi:MAG: hypothetical protein Q8O67_07080 [Deltaproteobacteria bacterium]|nr:hypothetical protein [Deltaproteobacteria bacterium]
MTTPALPEVKRIGDTGQISVGKALAGKLVRVELAADGVMLRFVVDVPEQDAWWLHEPHKSKLQQALAWAAKNPPSETDLDVLLARAKKAAPPAKAKRAPAKRTARKKQ